jgi:pyruvate/2-oxoglutarate dehydrogenase complex dihydrolipoamide acyltransferase (E2) component
MTQLVKVPEFELPHVPWTLCAWLMATGSEVVAGDSLCEISAGDISVEAVAPCSGVFHRARLELDSVLEVGAVVGEIRSTSES